MHHDPMSLQSEALLSGLRQALNDAGVGPESVVRLSQWFAGQVDWPAGSEWSGISITRYMEARERWLPSGIPASVAVAARRLPVAGGLVGLDALAVVNEDREVLMPPEDRAFPAGIRVGGYIHLSGELPTDWKGRDGSAVAPEARVDPALWYGYPVRAQTDYLLRRLSETAERAGSALSRAVHATVFLPDAGDLVGFEEAWREWFPESPPSRTIVPGVGLACRGCRVEIALDLLVRETPVPIVPADLTVPPGHESPATRAGDLLYISGQMAVGEDGVDPRGLPDPVFPDLDTPPAAQLEIILERVQKICAAAGADLDDLIQVRLFFPDLRDFGPALFAWKNVFGSSSPTGTALGVGPLPVPGCRVLMDAIAHVPESQAIHSGTAS